MLEEKETIVRPFLCVTSALALMCAFPASAHTNMAYVRNRTHFPKPTEAERALYFQIKDQCVLDTKKFMDNMDSGPEPITYVIYDTQGKHVLTRAEYIEAVEWSCITYWILLRPEFKRFMPKPTK